MNKLYELDEILEDTERDEKIFDLFESIWKENIDLKRAHEYKFHEIERLKKENLELRRANADKFGQVEALKKQVNNLNSKNKTVGKEMVDNLLEMMIMIRDAPNDVTRNACLNSTIGALKETQSAAQRILDKDK